ncbi:XRE family transcriptional regulator [Elizabethkingia ursingii]|uniref:XRE family transcriptional regulator n=1 Tax=Elizabethkingia ursingii TaxID=1756150 RepID=UPI0020139EAA|nr:XRE family transcriptional regulator [Elizabethkingia ursingii]MCL1665788.1 XRE family transcriptional regulator [Elizabethkingia ursingii]
MPRLTAKNIILRNNIKKRINELISSYDIRKVDLANNALKDRQAINRWTNINEDRGISIYTVEEFCDIMNISLSQFFDSPIFTPKSISR